jgi:pimeloyl-ACP methyl ester carboxylesterase
MSDTLATPTTHFADSDGVSIAYQVFGSGAQDLVVVPGIVSHVEANWHYEAYAALLRRLAQRFRVLIFDKRGQGMSDRLEGVPTLEQRMDDVRVVMQAAGMQRATLFASSEGGAMAALLTATHPALVDRLVMFASMARFTKAADFPIRPSLEPKVTATRWSRPSCGLRTQAPRLLHMSQPSAGWPPCSSPTSWARPNAPRGLATAPGASCKSALTPWAPASFKPTAGVKSTLPATASSPPSTARHAPCAARWPCWPRRKALA